MRDDVIAFGRFRLSTAERLLQQNGQPIKLSGRAIDILIALVRRAGEIVDKRDLMALVWPGVTVGENSVRFHVAALRRVLEKGQSGARYLITLPGQGYCFVAPITRLAMSPAEATKDSTAASSKKLPRPLKRMIGRAGAIQEISAQLSSDRFVTIVGPGGIGKTTVAVWLAHLLADQFEGAAYFFDLGPLNDARLVSATVASLLGIAVQSDDPTPDLIAFLQNKRMLLIFDSCEHVVETVSSLTERIFQEASLVHILATSREPLRVEGERIHRIPPLESPPDNLDLTAAEVLSFPAAQLFVERAAASGGSLQLTDGDASIVGEICRRLDGIALAIELAAGRVTTHGVRETAVLLNQRFRLLWDGRRTALLRHQTLNATLDWSYNLLSEQERIVLRRLAVFVGIFTLEAARSVTAYGAIGESEVVSVVDNLVSKSLISVDSRDATTNFRLLDTSRAYALDKLAGCGEDGPIAQRHAIYYLQVLERSSTVSSAALEAGWPHAAAIHLGNIRAALEWSFSERGHQATGIALAAASIDLFLTMSLLTECHRWTEQALEAQGSSVRGTRCEMKLQSALGLSLMFTRGNTDRARIALTRSLEAAQQLGDLDNQLQLLGRLHVYHVRVGDYRDAVTLAKRGRAVAAELADPVGIADAHSALGISYHMEGNNSDAHLHLEAALVELPVSRRIGRFHFGFDYRNLARIALARTLWLEGYPDRAVMVANQAVQLAEAANHPVTLCVTLIWAASVFLWVGDLDSAEEYIERFSAQADRHSLAPYQAAALGFQGELLVKRRDPETGIRLLRGSLERLQALRYQLVTTAFNSTLAEGLATMGQLQSSLRVIDHAIASVERNGDLSYLPELLRIRGNTLMACVASQVEQCFLRSLEIARRQSARAWELRTTTSLARFFANQNRNGEARALLASVHGRFTEGFETRDYRVAERLLARLDCPDRKPVGSLPSAGAFANQKPTAIFPVRQL